MNNLFKRNSYKIISHHKPNENRSIRNIDNKIKREKSNNSINNKIAKIKKKIPINSNKGKIINKGKIKEYKSYKIFNIPINDV